MRKSRLTAVLLALALAASLAVPASAAEEHWLVPRVREASGFTDTAGAWCQAAVDTAWEAGLLDGRSETRFDPQALLMPEELVAACARLHSRLSGGDGAFPAAAEGDAWYQPYYDYLAEALNYEGGADALMQNVHAGKSPCRRWMLADLLARTLAASGAALPERNQVEALPDCAEEAVLALYRAGVLGGTDAYGAFDGNAYVSRGQAAAALARVVDPAQRLTFSLRVFSYARDGLGLDPAATLLTVDGYAVTADLYAYFLRSAVLSYAADREPRLYAAYPAYGEDYWADETFPGSFADYLLEKHGIDVSDEAIDWNAPDRAGLTPAQRVQADALENVRALAVTLDHAASGGYGLSAAQRAELDRSAAAPFGFTADTAAAALAYMELLGNLTKKTLAEQDVATYLRQSGLVCGHCLILSKERTSASNAQKVLQAAQKRAGDAEFFESLVWRYGDNPSEGEPVLLSREELGDAQWARLEALSDGQVDMVETEGAYVLLLRVVPDADSPTAQQVALAVAGQQVSRWAAAAGTTPGSGWDQVDAARFYQAMQAAEALSA